MVGRKQNIINNLKSDSGHSAVLINDAEGFDRYSDKQKRKQKTTADLVIDSAINSSQTNVIKIQPPAAALHIYNQLKSIGNYQYLSNGSTISNRDFKANSSGFVVDRKM
ncbi:MAG: hypothetical protein NT007_10920 [Candidatus Kapabacteria bacterium]|nr:hypothetical protein [Candidatus Kapabacteria bacterium]